MDWDSREVGQGKDLTDHAWQVRIRVEHALIALGADAVPALVDACASSDRHVRLLAAYVLGYLNDDSAIPALIQVARADQ